MNRMTALLLALIMALSLAACGGNSSDNDPASKITEADLEGNWVREDTGWPAEAVGDKFIVTTISSSGSESQAHKNIYSVKDGIMSLSSIKGDDDYKIIVEDGKVVRLEGMYTYVRAD